MQRSCHRAALGSFAPPQAEAHYRPHLRLVPQHLDLRVAVHVPEKRLEVELELHVRAQASGVRSLELDAIDFHDLVVDVSGAGDGRYDGRVVTVTWARAFEAGEVRRVRLCYRVIEPITGVCFSAPDARRPDAPTFAATDHETERARYWLAMVDHPAARPSLDIRVRTDARWVVLANGAQRGEELHPDATKTVHYHQGAGCPSYLVCFAVGPFVRWDGGQHGATPIAAFAVPPFTPEHLARTFGRTREMLAFLSERLGVSYPFDKYYQFAVEGIGGAMENISLVSWDDRFLLDATLEREERELVDSINVHEMAHSWFGDSVVCSDFAHTWLKEGWATYLESCWFETKYGADAMACVLWDEADRYFAEVDDKYRRPIVTRKYDSSFDLFDAHLYPGAALRIHMLRRQLGDEVFWPAVREYLTRYAGGLAETDDFRRVLEERSGLSLGRFFDQWFSSAGFPDLELSFRYDADAREGVFEFVQKQANEKTGAGAFELELEIACATPDGMTRRRVTLSGRRTLAVVRLESEPELIQVDPDGCVLHRLDFDPGLPRLLAQLRHGNARGRIQAGVLLCRHAGRDGARALQAAFSNEPLWRVRVKWAEALGRAASQAALEALLALAGSQQDPRGLAALLAALGKYRDPRVTEVVCRRLDRGLPHRAAEAALEALGAQREAAPLDRLLAAAAQPGYGGFVQSGALRALGATRRREAVEALVRALAPDGAPDRVRPAAAEGLGSLAKVLDDRARERAIEALVDALRDPMPRVQLAAAQALGSARATEASAELEALSRRLSHQDAARVRRVLRDVKARAGKQAQAKALDELEERVRKLALKLDELQARIGPAR